ncbi:MAG: methyltransferase domain-containing protein [Myxococcales bacterium]|nr:methyltransferase domain-containing protein [Myxococcales bacterium]
MSASGNPSGGVAADEASAAGASGPEDERATQPRGISAVSPGETEVLVSRTAAAAPPVEVESSQPATVSGSSGMRIVKRRIKHIGRDSSAPTESASAPPVSIAPSVAAPPVSAAPSHPAPMLETLPSDLPPGAAAPSVDGVGSPKMPSDLAAFAESVASSPAPDPALLLGEDLESAITNVMPKLDAPEFDQGPTLESEGEVELAPEVVPRGAEPRRKSLTPRAVPSVPPTVAELDAVLPVAPVSSSAPPPALPKRPSVAPPPVPAVERAAPRVPPPSAPPVTASANADADSEPATLLSTPDDGIEIALSDLATSGDPSLAMLDLLADLPPVAGQGPEPVRPPGLPRGTSLPPPPPPESARGAKSPPAPPTPPASSLRSTVVTTKARRRLWWEELFNEDYFRTIEPYDEAQARREADWIEHALGVEQGARVIDVGCGPGRQAIALGGRGYSILGLDYSPAMLGRGNEKAREAGVKVEFVQGDMAAMEYDNEFDAAYCVGTSFGFFDDERNFEVARRIHRALKPSGTFLLAVLNRDHAIQRQPAMSWFEGDGCICMEESSFNYITSRLNVKRTMIFDDGRQRELEYGVRLYSLHELGQMLHQTGFRIVEVSGHQRTPGAFFGPSSRELIILAQRRAQEELPLQPES